MIGALLFIFLSINNYIGANEATKLKNTSFDWPTLNKTKQHGGRVLVNIADRAVS